MKGNHNFCELEVNPFPHKHNIKLVNTYLIELSSQIELNRCEPITEYLTIRQEDHLKQIISYHIIESSDTGNIPIGYVFIENACSIKCIVHVLNVPHIPVGKTCTLELGCLSEPEQEANALVNKQQGSFIFHPPRTHVSAKEKQVLVCMLSQKHNPSQPYPVANSL